MRISISEPDTSRRSFFGTRSNQSKTVVNRFRHANWQRLAKTLNVLSGDDLSSDRTLLESIHSELHAKASSREQEKGWFPGSEASVSHCSFVWVSGRIYWETNKMADEPSCAAPKSVSAEVLASSSVTACAGRPSDLGMVDSW